MNSIFQKTSYCKTCFLSSLLSIVLLLACGAIPGVGFGGESYGNVIAPSAGDEHCHLSRPDRLAPIGVMYDHAHAAGGLMFGYRFAWEHDSGLRKGRSEISPEQVFRERAPDGSRYNATALDMDMTMHMFEIMYAPTDWMTLMVMPMYMEMTMTMRRAAGMEHSHSTGGWGDTVLAAMFPLAERGGHGLLLNLGLSMPTGAVDLQHRGMLTHYMMQLGSGTWDLLPGLTYTGHNDRFSWGVQSIATWRMEDANASGYRLGDGLDTTAWLATPLTDWLGISGRIAWQHEGDIKGSYNAPHRRNSPPDFQANYGGDRIDLGLGLNFLVPSGPLAGHRFGVEALAPVYQDANGIQTSREVSLTAGWTFHY